ncbi:MAG: methyltransferase domain-containing protein [Actinomycetota bacterium]
MTTRPRGRTRLFDRWSRSYDDARLQAATYRPIHDAILARLAPAIRRAEASGRAFRILDLGCGTGQFAARLVTDQAAPDRSTGTTVGRIEVVGLDLSAGMLTRAAARLDGAVGLVRADAQVLPLASGSFDAVACTESFHWYPDQRAALAECHRILGPDGQLLVASIATATRTGDALVRSVSTALGQPVRARPGRALARLFGDAGFRVIEQQRIPRRGLVPWPVLTVAARTDGRMATAPATG